MTLQHVHPAVACEVMSAARPSMVDEIEASVAGPALAVMLYGSQARGSADDGSDVDVLQVVASGAGAYKVGRVAVTMYTAAHLHQMALHGSLFVLHLRSEGLIIRDPHQVLRRALDSYQAPESYDQLVSELALAARAVMVVGEQLDQHHQAIGRLGIYLLRSWLYVSAVRAGAPHFDADDLARSAGGRDLMRVLALRRVDILTSQDVAAIQAQVGRTFSVSPHDDSLLAFAVSLARSKPQASALVSQVISSGDSLDYAGLPLPPL